MSDPAPSPAPSPVTAPEVAPEVAPASPLGGTPAPAAEAPAPEAAPTLTDKLYPEGTPPVEAPAEAAPKDPPAEEPKPEEAKPEEAPAPIEFTLPEGAEIAPESMAAFQEFVSTAKLDKETGQKLLDLHFAQMKTANENLATATSRAWESTIEGWRAEIASDPVIGGAKQEAAMHTLGRALDEYGTPETRAAFDATGAGWNPHIIRFVHKMASQLVEGGPVAPRGPVSTKAGSLGAALYGDTPAS